MSFSVGGQDLEELSSIAWSPDVKACGSWFQEGLKRTAASVNEVAVCPYLHQVLVDPFCEGLFLNSVPFICDRNKENKDAFYESSNDMTGFDPEEASLHPSSTAAA